MGVAGEALSAGGLTNQDHRLSHRAPSVPSRPRDAPWGNQGPVSESPDTVKTAWMQGFW
jgi:hypothetical protein